MNREDGKKIVAKTMTGLVGIKIIFCPVLSDVNKNRGHLLVGVRQYEKLNSSS